MHDHKPNAWEVMARRMYSSVDSLAELMRDAKKKRNRFWRAREEVRKTLEMGTPPTDELRWQCLIDLAHLDQILTHLEPTDDMLKKLEQAVMGASRPRPPHKDDSARNYQSELFVGSKFAERGLAVQFGDPDVRVATAYGDALVEVKRCRSESKVEQRAKEARTQALGHASRPNEFCIAVVDLSHLRERISVPGEAIKLMAHSQSDSCGRPFARPVSFVVFETIRNPNPCGLSLTTAHHVVPVPRYADLEQVEAHRLLLAKLFPES